MDSWYDLAKRGIWCTLSVLIAVLMVGELPGTSSADSHPFAESAQGEPISESIVPEEEEEPGDDDEANLWAMLLAQRSPSGSHPAKPRDGQVSDEAHVSGVFRPPRAA